MKPNLQFVAHMSEIEEAINALLAGEDFTFSFDLTEYDKWYITTRIEKLVGSDATIIFD